MGLATIDITVVVIYAIGIFGLAQWVSRDKAGAGSKNSTDYFLASKNLPWWAIGASLVAAIIASTASKINSIATIFTLDVWAKFRKTEVAGDAQERRLVLVGRIAAAVASVALSWALKVWMPVIPFMDRMGLCFLAALVLAVVVSLATPARPDKDTISTGDVRYATSTGFNAGAIAVVLVLCVLYAVFW